MEPFCGGLAVTLGLLPHRALVNDVNPHLMNLYRWLKRGLTISIPMKNDEAMYYAHRERFNELVSRGAQDSREAAELFYYLNRTGYNGLCRFNQQGGFNVPFGRYAKITYMKAFRNYRKLFVNWTFRCKNFQTVTLAANDFVYADPPYDVEFTQYARDGFSWEDQVKAAEWLADHLGPVILSNQATKRILALYKRLGFKLKFLSAPRMISCTGDRTRAREVLATKNL